MTLSPSQITYYQVLVEATETIKKNTKNKQYIERDNTDLVDIKTRIIYPYLRNEGFQFNGYFLKHEEIKRITIKQTQDTTKALAEQENNIIRRKTPGFILNVSPENIVNFDQYAKDITVPIFNEAKTEVSNNQKSEIPKINNSDLTKIFIVHGRDKQAETEVARFIEKLGFSAIILHEQASSGNTVIEKIEENTNVGFAIILYTPCDKGSLADKENQKFRARQNVVFEHGYLVCKLGRQKVCTLVKGDIETPNDISGIVYIPLDEQRAWHMAIAKELRTAGYAVDMNKII